MGDRLTRIYTRTGDEGSTGLASGTRLPKDHPRIEALGCIDELNSLIGLTLAQNAWEIAQILAPVQHQLFELGAELAQPGAIRILPRHVTGLEASIDAWNARLPPLREFVLPGGNPAAASCHLARAVCRRAERRLVGLATIEPCNHESLRYLNRLSDFLFAAARVLARTTGSETLWQPEVSGP